MIWCMGPNEWVSSIRCSAKLEVVLWFRQAVLCSLFVRHTFSDSQGKLVRIPLRGSICRVLGLCG